MKSIRTRPWLWLFLGALMLSGWFPELGTTGDPTRRFEEKVLKQASVNGKYGQLLRKFESPSDRDNFTSFCDWGYGEIPNYGTYTDLPSGYWVYVAPHWYIWGAMDPYANREFEAASVKGKYDRLLRKITLATDWKVNGRFKETGFSRLTEYKGYKDLPPGYWVYRFPHWYIWEGQAQPLSGELLEASMYCKYSRLLRRLTVPDDQEVYPWLHDAGYFEGGSYGTERNLPRGYWVYVAPNWYIWGENRAGGYYLRADPPPATPPP